MAIIKQNKNGTTYVYEVSYYNDNGKEKRKWKSLGKLDADGNVIPSKKRASAESISLDSLKSSLSSLDSLNSQNYSQNSPNINNNVNDIENNNDTIVTAVTASMNDTAAVNIAATVATAATATTTEADVADNVSDTTHNNISGTSITSDTETTPVVKDNISVYSVDDEFAETNIEAPIDIVYDEPNEAQTSPVAFIANNDISGVVHKTHKTGGTEVTPVSVSEAPSIPTNYSGNQNVPALSNAQDSVELVAVVDVDQESTGENPSQLPQVISQKAEQFKVNMSKLENIAFTPSKNVSVYEATDINTVKVNVSRGKSPKKRVETLLYIDFNDAKVNGLNISHEDRLTPYDREVHNAVATLVAAGNICINPYMIFQVLSGNSSDKTKSGMSPETRENIVKSLNKMRFTNVKINASAEVKAGMILEGSIESYLIPAKRTEAMLNGQIIKDCIYLYDMLPLFNYAGMKNQIASVDVKMLDTPLANTSENIVLKCYVLKRILSISNEKNNMHDAIRYSTVYEYLDIQAPNKDLLNHKRKQIRDKIRKLLNYWKGEKLIKDYREEKEGRTFAKVIIFVF